MMRQILIRLTVLRLADGNSVFCSGPCVRIGAYPLSRQLSTCCARRTKLTAWSRVSVPGLFVTFVICAAFTE